MPGKSIEIILRGRDELSRTFAAGSTAARDMARSLGIVDKSYKQIQREIDRTQKLEANLAQQRLKLVGQARDQTKSIEQRRQATSQLLRVEEKLAATSKHLNDQRKALPRVQREGQGQAALQLERQREQSLRRQADLGDRKAQIALRELNINRQHTAQMRELRRIAHSATADDMQRLAAKRAMINLERVHAREMRQAQRGRGGQLGSFGRGAAQGLQMSGALGPASMGAMIFSGAGAAVAAGTGAALVGGLLLRQAVNEFADFEHAMSRVKALTGATRAEMESLGEQAMQLGRDTVYTAVQAAEAMGKFALAGFEVKEILEATPATLNLAAAGELEMAEAADIVVGILKGMGLQAKDTADVVDILTKAMTTANTDLRQLGHAFSFVGPVAMQAGAELTEVAAALQVLANNAIKGERGGTALRQIFLRLANPTGEAKAEIDRLGITVSDAQGNFKDLADIVGQFDRALAGVGSQERLRVLSQIFETRNAAAFATLMETGMATLRQMKSELDDFHGTAAEQASVRLDNLRGDIVKLKSAWSSLMISMGEGNSGYLRWMVQDLKDVTNAFDELQKHRGLKDVGRWTAMGGPAAILDMLTAGDQAKNERNAERQKQAGKPLKKLREEALKELQQLGVQGLNIDSPAVISHARRMTEQRREASNAAGIRTAMIEQADQRANTLLGNGEDAVTQKSAANEAAETESRLRKRLADSWSIAENPFASGGVRIKAEAEALKIQEQLNQIEAERAKTAQDILDQERDAYLATKDDTESRAELARIGAAREIQARRTALEDLLANDRITGAARSSAATMLNRLNQTADSQISGAGQLVMKREAERLERESERRDQLIKTSARGLLSGAMQLVTDPAQRAELQRASIAMEFEDRRSRLNESLEGASGAQAERIKMLLGGLNKLEAAQLAAVDKNAGGAGGRGRFEYIDQVSQRFKVLDGGRRNDPAQKTAEATNQLVDLVRGITNKIPDKHTQPTETASNSNVTVEFVPMGGNS